jgi:3-dehydroquinate synthase
MTADVFHQRFTVPFDYPVHFTRAALDPANGLLAGVVGRLGEKRVHRVAAFLDDGVARAWPELPSRLQAYAARHAGVLRLEGPPEIVPGGEQSKNSLVAAERVMERLAALHLCRQSCVLAIGGGSALDVVGLAASLAHRGLRVVRMPTTTLSQADSGVGVKTSVDAYGMKNFAGTFAPPFGVISDFDFLRTLEWPYWIGGVAEAFKVAVIRDAAFFALLREGAALLRARNDDFIEGVVRRAALLHLEHIRTAGDPFEFGAARPLDFGHWAAHKLETMSGYSIGHGQAVAIGMALDSHQAFRRGLLPEQDLDAILAALRAAGLPVWSPLLRRRGADGEFEVLAGIEDFREHLGGPLTVTLPETIGRAREVHELNLDTVREGIAFLERHA